MIRHANPELEQSIYRVADQTGLLPSVVRACLTAYIADSDPKELAKAWEEGAQAGWRQSGQGWNAEYPDEASGSCSVDVGDNPYRSQA